MKFQESCGPLGVAATSIKSLVCTAIDTIIFGCSVFYFLVDCIDHRSCSNFQIPR